MKTDPLDLHLNEPAPEAKPPTELELFQAALEEICIPIFLEYPLPPDFRPDDPGRELRWALIHDTRGTLHDLLIDVCNRWIDSQKRS